MPQWREKGGGEWGVGGSRLGPMARHGHQIEIWLPGQEWGGGVRTTNIKYGFSLAKPKAEAEFLNF